MCGYTIEKSDGTIVSHDSVYNPDDATKNHRKQQMAYAMLTEQEAEMMHSSSPIYVNGKKYLLCKNSLQDFYAYKKKIDPDKDIETAKNLFNQHLADYVEDKKNLGK